MDDLTAERYPPKRRRRSRPQDGPDLTDEIALRRAVLAAALRGSTRRQAPQRTEEST